MSTKQEKINAVVNERRVKLHRFNPSQREIWTIVGKEKEHWIDPESNFCSCSGYYFGMIKSKGVEISSITVPTHGANIPSIPINNEFGI